MVEERELGGSWQANQVTSGDFFLTISPTPYELRWKARGPQPFEVMHLYLGLPIFNRAVKDVFNQLFDALSGFFGFPDAADGEFRSGVIFVLRNKSGRLDENAVQTAHGIEDAPVLEPSK